MPYDVQAALDNSVQVKPDAKQGAVVLRLGELRGVTLPPWGSRARERVLRWWDRSDANWLWQGARAGLINKWLATPYTVSGPQTGANAASYYHDVLRQAEFGDGWDVMWSKVWRDFLRHDGGAYVEIIAPGDPTQPPTGRISGLAHLDSLRCYPTGDPEFPVIYYNRSGTKHKLHWTRVLHFVDMPDGDEFRPGYGECALSRAIAIAEQQYYMLRYVKGELDELPPPGFASLTNMSKEQFLEAVDEFQERRSRDLPPVYGNLVLLPGMARDIVPKVDITTYTRAPEKFDYPLWVNLQVNAMALVLGIDKQEIWELGGGSLGSGAQSEVLHMKSQGKMYGHMLSIATRNLNDVLPESCELVFERTDTYETREAGETANAWADFVGKVSDAITVDEKRQLLANTVKQFREVVVDDAGALVKLPDSDVKPPEADEDVNLDGDTTEDSGGGGADDAAYKTGFVDDAKAKAFADTANTFRRDFVDLVSAAQDGAMNRRRAGTVLRASLNRLGRQAFTDGQKDGGVEDGMDDADRLAFARILAEQSRYVTSFLDTLRKQGLTDAQAVVHADMWVSKSLRDFYTAGLNSAARNGLFEWQLGFAEHCRSCLDMAGQRHRMKDYYRKGIIPGSSRLICGGFACKCTLVRVTGKASGRWTKQLSTL